MLKNLSPDSLVAVVQRTGRSGQSSVDVRAITRLRPPAGIALQVLGFPGWVHASVSMGMMMMVMVVVQMMAIVVGRARDRFVGVRHRVRHESHHRFTRSRRSHAELGRSLRREGRCRNALIVHVFTLARAHHERLEMRSAPPGQYHARFNSNYPRLASSGEFAKLSMRPFSADFATCTRRLTRFPKNLEGSIRQKRSVCAGVADFSRNPLYSADSG